MQNPLINLVAQNISNITALGSYISKRTQRRSNDKKLIEYSKRIIRLKQGSSKAIEYFFDLIQSQIQDGCAIAVVPSHDFRRKQTGIATLAEKLALRLGCTDATACLNRFMTIPKSSSGGIRGEGIHFESIAVNNRHLIADRHVLLLDDVTTTGSSLRACKTLLLAAGAKSVTCIALGRTLRAEI